MKCLRSVAWVAMLPLLIATPTPAQNPDPFSAEADAADPFQPRSPLPGAALRIQLRLLDSNADPVPSARIFVETATRLETDANGIAVWKTTDRQLKQLANDGTRGIRIVVVPPRDTLMPRIVQRYSVANLVSAKSLDFHGRPGVRLRGLVVDKESKQPIPGVSVLIKSKADSNAREAENFLCSTDENGKWSVVVPRGGASVVLHRLPRGYENGETPATQRLLDLTEKDREVTVTPLEVEANEPWTVNVVLNEKPVTDASVQAWDVQALTPGFLLLNSASSPQTTDAQGQCRIELNSRVTRGFFRAESQSGKVRYAGRSSVTGPSHEVVVHLRPLATVAGLVTQGDRVAPDARLVIYEMASGSDEPETSSPIALRDETSTDKNGRFAFEVERGLRYAIATKRRSAEGRQEILHRTPALNEPQYQVPPLEFPTTFTLK